MLAGRFFTTVLTGKPLQDSTFVYFFSLLMLDSLYFYISFGYLESESEVAQSCPTPSDPRDCSPPDSSIHGILQARVLDWGAIAYRILKSRDITLSTKVCLVKAMVFPVDMYGCESWTEKKAEHQRIDACELWCWRRLLRVPWTGRTSPF